MTLCCSRITRFTVINPNVAQEPTEEAIQRTPKYNVDLNHSWTITFNKAVDPNTINNQNIFIFNSSSARIPVNVTPGSDGKSAIVSLNNTQYRANGEYTLHISSAVKSASNLALPEAIQMKFYTVN